MPFEPGADVGRLVGGHVVEDDMELACGVGPLEVRRKARKSAPVWRARASVVTLPVATSSAARRLVVPLRLTSWVWRSTWPGFIGSIGAVRSSAWIWVFSSRESTIARSGGAR